MIPVDERADSRLVSKDMEDRGQHRRKGKARRQWLPEAPVFHRWVFGFGLLLIALWSPTLLADGLIKTRTPILTKEAHEFLDLFFVVGVACATFGFLLEVAFGVASGFMVRRSEEQSLSDLCGRTRFRRGKKKYIAIPFPPGEEPGEEPEECVIRH